LMPGDADTAPGLEPTDPPLGRGFGHGKVILVGEHAVVHGHTALAAGISTGIAVEARAGRAPGESRLSVPAWNLEASASDGTPVGRALEAIIRRIEAPGLDFMADARIPSRAGLGSSAALSVAIARAAAGAVGRGDATDAIDAAVMAAEEVFHGSPSGIDAAAAKSGVTGRFTRAGGWRPVPVLQKITICIGLSGRPRDTVAQVAAVGRLRARLPVAGEVLALLGRLADEAGDALAKGDVDGLGRIMDASHGLLAALRLSSPELDTLVHGARAAGAVGAKLTGAGGGGAVIALAPGHTRDVLARWKAAGYEGFLADIVAAPASAPSAPVAGAPR
jgi:mevalonate kinase